MLQEVNLFNVMNELWEKYALRCFIIASMASLIAGVYVFSLPRYYSATTQVIPESSEENGLSLPKSLSQLSSMAGVSLSTMSGKDAINPDIYPDIFNSNNFIVDVLKLNVINSKEKKVSYYKYLTQEQKQPWWSSLIATITSKEEKIPQELSFTATRFSIEEENLMKAIKKNIKCDIDKKTGMINLTTIADDPFVAASLANVIMEHLQKYIIDYRTKKAKNDLEYTQKLLKEAKSNYALTQQKYIRYADTHNDVILSAYRTKLADLENEMQQGFNAVTQISQQVELAKAKLQERTPAFTVIQEAAVPVRPAGPKRVYTVLLTFISVFFATACICIFKYK